MPQLLFLDLETTGLCASRDEIIELSAVLVDEHLNEVAVFDRLVQPKKELPEIATAITGITPAMLKDAPSTEQVRQDFADFAAQIEKNGSGPVIIAGHNIEFDMSFLHAGGFALASAASLDTFPLSYLLLPDAPSHALETLTAAWGIQHHNAHRALADVRANIDLCRVLLKKAAEDFSAAERQKILQSIREYADWPGGEYFFERAFASRPPTGKKSPKQPQGQADMFAEMPPKSSGFEQRAEGWAAAAKSGGALVESAPGESELEMAVAAARRLGGGSAVLVPSLLGAQTPPGFLRHVPAGRKYGLGRAEAVRAKNSRLLEAECVFMIKICIRKMRGEPLAECDIPRHHPEREFFELWLEEGKKMAPTRSFPEVELPIFSDVSAAKQLREQHKVNTFCIPFADQLETPITKQLTSYVRTESLERRLLALARRGTQKGAPLAQKALFSLGLLLQFVRTHIQKEAPPGSFAPNAHRMFPEQLQSREGQNIAKDMASIAAELAQLPEEHPALEKGFLALAHALSTEIADDEIRFVRVLPDETCMFTVVRGSPQRRFQKDILEGGGEHLFFGHNFCTKRDGLYLGTSVKAPEIQSVPAETKNTKNIQDWLFFMPSGYGVGRLDPPEKTIELCAHLAKTPDVGGRVLVVFPSASMAAEAAAQLETLLAEAGKNGEAAEIRLLSGSVGKAQTLVSRSTNNALLIASAGMARQLRLADFGLCGAVFHRLPFEPPASPAMQHFLGGQDSFANVGLPRAEKYFLDFAHQLRACPAKRFFWAHLDAHFCKKAGFAAQFVGKIKPHFALRRVDISAFAGDIAAHLRSG